MFNPNELLLEKIRAVEEYDPSTDELTGRYTQIESPSLETGATATEVTDAMGTSIATFYTAQTGTFGFTNSLFSLDLAASQYGTEKQIATSEAKITMPVSETIAIAADHTVTLKYVPVGTSGSEVKFVKVINTNNTFGETYTVSATPGTGKFTLNAATKTITLPNDVTGKVFVKYDKASSTAVKVSKSTNAVPEVKKLLIHAIFHDPCDKNLVYAGVISCPRAQIDITSTTVALTPDGKHSASYKLEKPYCDESATLFDILVSED
jgi:hypothetical protein